MKIEEKIHNISDTVRSLKEQNTDLSELKEKGKSKPLKLFYIF